MHSVVRNARRHSEDSIYEDGVDDMPITVPHSSDSHHLLNQHQQPPYPKRVFFIIGTEFCERFNYYGMRAILVLYMTQTLHWDENTATVSYHAFSMMAYLMCIFGSILSDVWLGKFRTIFFLSLVYAIGSATVSMSTVPIFHLPANELLYIGLALIAMGIGGIKPCVAAFGADQFTLPEQTAQMSTYFSLFIFSINAGSFISTLATPMLRANVHCFGQNDCYSLAFGVPAALMIVAILIFVSGRPLYTTNATPSENMIFQILSCVWTAFSERKRERNTDPQHRFLDYAIPKHGIVLVNDIRKILKIITIYAPLCLFWTLDNQQGSRWTFQATKMNGNVGVYEIRPDQMQVLSPILLMVLIPFYNTVLCPLFDCVGSLQRLMIGGLLASVAFMFASVVEFETQKSYPVLPKAGEAQLRYFNGFPCDYAAATNNPSAANFTLKSLNAFEQKHIAVYGKQSLHYEFQRIINVSTECPEKIESQIRLNESTASSIFISTNTHDYIDDPSKPLSGDPKLRLLVSINGVQNLTLRNSKSNYILHLNTSDQTLRSIVSGRYSVSIGERQIASLKFRQGGVYTVIIHQNSNRKFTLRQIEVTAPNSISILWQIPQYFVITLGGVIVTVTGYEFSYAIAPECMKSVVQALWLLNVSNGDLINMIVVHFSFFDSQAMEFLFFGILMFIDMMIFSIIASRLSLECDANDGTRFTSTDLLYSDDDRRENDYDDSILPGGY